MQKKPRGRPKKVKTAERLAIPKEVEVEVEVKELYDEYGVCISCKGGKEGCLHNNLTQNGQKTVCVKCGLIV